MSYLPPFHMYPRYERGITGIACEWPHPLSHAYLMDFNPDELSEMHEHLSRCLSNPCSNPECAVRFPRGRPRVKRTLTKIENILGTMNIPDPIWVQPVIQPWLVQPQMIVQPTIQQGSRSVVRNVHRQPQVQTTVIEEHIHEPDPLYITETRTIVHEGGRTYEASRTSTVEEGAPSNRANGNNQRQRITSLEVEGYSNNDGGNGRRQITHQQGWHRDQPSNEYDYFSNSS